MKQKITYLFSIGLLLCIWQLIAMSMNNPFLFPTLPALAQSLVELLTSGNFYYSLLVTIGRWIRGICLSFVPATLFALLFARQPLIYELFRPLLSIMRSVPVISFILLALLFLTPEMIPLLIGFITMFPILAENLTQGILHADKELRQMGKLFHIGRYNYFTQICYPQVKPFLYSGLATATGFGWRAVIMGEVLSQCSSGIGSEMKKAQLFISIPELLAWTAIAVLVSFIADRGIGKLRSWSPRIKYGKARNGSTRLNDTIHEPVYFRDVSFQYGDTPVIRHFTQEIRPGKITGLSAPSGKGKTTLLSLLNGLLKPDQGEIVNLPGQTGNVFQNPRLLPHLSLTENIALPLAGRMSRTEATRIAALWIEQMELTGLEDRLPEESSYGQQQRAAIARALAYPAPLLLLDEPFKGLDKELTARIMQVIRQHRQNTGQTILFTSHQPTEIKELGDYIIGID
ncbi:MAG: ATP-binding cassette domain-containing protein [Tannerellaceae bacterium]|nr:ATP-binding cassette domain-containing protein [Tannerellaceae bacterium]